MALPLLLTRPEAQSREFTAILGARAPERFETVVSPLVRIVPEQASVDLSGVQALLFSSGNAVRAFANRWHDRHIPALCVGDKTMAEAEKVGLSAQSASGDVAALADMAAGAYLEGGGHYLYLRGRKTAGDLAGSLMAQDITVDEAILYDQVPQPLNDDAKGVLARAGSVIVPVFSPKSGERLAQELADPDLIRNAPLVVVAISQNAAQSCSEISNTKVFLAPTPSAEGILEILLAI